MSIYSFQLTGATCSGCPPNIIFLINYHLAEYPSAIRMKGEPQFSTDYQKIHIEIEDTPDIDEEDILAFLNAAINPPYAVDKQESKKSSMRWIMGGIGVGLGTALLALMFFTNPLLAVMVPIGVVSIGLTLFLGAEFYIKARTELARKSPAMDVLFAISSLTVMIVSLAALFVPGLPMMFEAGLLIFGFRHLGLAIKDSLIESMGVRKTYQSLVPKKVQKWHTNQFESVDVDTIQPGDILKVAAGEIIPIDGWFWLDPETQKQQKAYVNVWRVEGSHTPRLFHYQEPMSAGMYAESDLYLRVGLGYKFCPLYETSEAFTPEQDTLYFYLDHNDVICIQGRLLKDGPLQTIQMDDHVLGSHAESLRNGLKARNIHFQEQDKQHLMLAFLEHANAYGFNKTSSHLAQLDHDIQQSELTKASIEEKTETILKYFVPAVLLIAIASGIAIGCFFSPMMAVQCAASILISACPCTLGLITPLAIQVARKKGIKNGIFFKKADALQNMADVDTFIFDLHGTLTVGKPTVFIQPWDEQEMIDEYLALLEHNVTHWIAKAIYKKVDGDAKIKESKCIVEEHMVDPEQPGVSLLINGKKYLLGNQKFIPEVDCSKFDSRISKNQVFLVRMDENKPTVLATIAIQDPLRPDAPKMMELLKKRKTGKQHEVEIYISSGNSTAVETYLPALKLPSDCIVNNRIDGKIDKRPFVEKKIKEGKKVLYVGDGTNDNPVMSLAIAAGHIGIAMAHSHGDKLLQEKASAIIQNNHLLPLVSSMDISSQMMLNITQNLLFSLIYNITVMALSVGILLAFGMGCPPSIGVALMILQIGLILLNTYRFDQQSVVQYEEVVDEPDLIPVLSVAA